MSIRSLNLIYFTCALGVIALLFTDFYKLGVIYALLLMFIYIPAFNILSYLKSKDDNVVELKVISSKVIGGPDDKV